MTYIFVLFSVLTDLLKIDDPRRPPFGLVLFLDWVTAPVTVWGQGGPSRRWNGHRRRRWRRFGWRLVPEVAATSEATASGSAGRWSGRRRRVLVEAATAPVTPSGGSHRRWQFVIFWLKLEQNIILSMQNKVSQLATKYLQGGDPKIMIHSSFFYGRREGLRCGVGSPWHLVR